MYLFYVDESGNLDTTLKTESGKDKDHIYVLTACGLWEGRWHQYYQDITLHKTRKMRELRSKDIDLHLEDCEVKSTLLRNPREREKSKFLKHFTEEELLEISRLYYGQIPKYKIVICSVVIDKRHLEEHFDRTKLHRKAWELLCERIVNFIYEFHPKHNVLIVKDDISKQENAELARKHSWFLSNRTSANISLKPIIEMPLFTRSELNEGLQLADLCAYNVYRAFRYQDFEYPFFKELLPYFCTSKRNSRKKIDGLKVFPDESPLVEMAKKISLC